MIGITSKIHDRKTLEFKIGYQVPEGTDYSDFEMATWIFIPEALDVNRHTYPREKFYHDMLSYMRLITPVYTLEKLALSSELPYQLLEKACQSIASQPTEQDKEEYEKEIKSYASIFKSSLRDTCKQLVVEAAEELPGHTQRMVEHIHHILDNYRSLQTTLQSKGPDASLLVYFTYGDEFLVNVTEQHLFKMLTRLKKERPTVYEGVIYICPLTSAATPFFWNSWCSAWPPACRWYSPPSSPLPSSRPMATSPYPSSWHW